MPQKRLIYILNHYANNSSSHFLHVIHLLEKMGEKGVSIALIIEKCEDIPKIQSPNIQLIPIHTTKLLRPWILGWQLLRLSRKGFRKIFIRISWRAAVLASFLALSSGQQCYFWHSSQGAIEYYRSQNAGIKKMILWVKTQLPFFLLKRLLFRLVTGPESMGEYYAAHFGFDPKKIMILYNDIDTRRFHPVPTEQKRLLRKKLGLPESKTLILFVHRFSPVRKSSYYFPVITDLFFRENDPSQSCFVFVGGGPERAELQKRLAGTWYAKSIHFLNEIPNAEIAACYQAGDLFIQPSYAEGFPRTTLEAMACGLPLVTTDAGGIRDVLGPLQQEFMVDKTDRTGFSNALLRLNNSPEWQLKCREENLHRVKAFDTETIRDMYMHKLFNES